MKTLIKKESNIEIEIKSFLEMYKKELKINNLTIDIDCNLIKEFSPELFDKLISDSNEIISILEKEVGEKFNGIYRINFLNFDNPIEINEMRAKHQNEFRNIKGIIKRVTKVLQRTISIKYECPSCGTTISVNQSYKKKIEPKKCSCGRRGGFKVIKESKVDIQEINLEEIPDNLDGRQPKQIRIYVREHLTENNFSKKLQPGKKIEIIGTIKEMPPFMMQKDESLNISECMIEAYNINLLEQESDIYVTEEDIKEIEEIASNNPLEKLADSLIPEVYGNEKIKKAIILQLVKGVSKKRSDGSMSRNDIHILLSGDPGVAKSRLLDAVSKKAPKSNIVVGTKTSRVGLGAMAVKDEMTNTWALECGALVLNSGGILSIDELDKMYKDNLSELLEPMSSGIISINKAGISAKLTARTSILASSNPIQGSFNLKEPIAKQLDLPSPIINRFDLIFILLDKPDKEFDKNSIEHIFKSYKEERIPNIDTTLFKKYIFYVKKLQPKLKDEILDELKEFYSLLRNRSNSVDNQGLPINLRNMEGLIRLSEAHAKLRLAKYVEKEDFDVAKEIFLYSLKQVGTDFETGLIDTSRMTQKVPISKRGKVESVLSILQELTEEFGKEIPIDKLKEDVEKLKINSYELNLYLEQLSKEGKLYNPRNGVVSLL